MANFWMVRAGEGGYLAEDFVRASCIGVGFDGAGDFTPVRTIQDMRAVMDRTFPDAKPQANAIAASTAFKFRHQMKAGDRIVTYDPQKREYILGTVASDYEYRPNVLPDYSHIRRVTWDRRVSRDALRPTSRNSLGSLVTIFAPGEEVLADLEAPESDAAPDQSAAAAPDEDVEDLRRDISGRAHEFIKDRLRSLSPADLEELVAALLRALGYKARVTPPGPDRGRDVVASPDGLGLQSPRIVAEVKHRARESMGAPQVRSFLGGLREGDRGLFVSTGGFSREARYEADRASVPITLVDLDELAALVAEHYEGFDAEGRALVPLVRIHWPAS